MHCTKRNMKRRNDIRIRFMYKYAVYRLRNIYLEVLFFAIWNKREIKYSWQWDLCKAITIIITIYTFLAVPVGTRRGSLVCVCGGGGGLGNKWLAHLLVIRGRMRNWSFLLPNSNTRGPLPKKISLSTGILCYKR